MTKEEFMKLDDDAQFKYLNDLAAQGKGFAEISAELKLTREDMGKLGFYFVKNKFMRKPMKGYQTTKHSGNEAEA